VGDGVNGGGSTHYTSPHHSAEDPGGLIADVLALGSDFVGPAPDILLSWTIRLSPEIASDQAAKTLIARYGLSRPTQCETPHDQLLDLLFQAAEPPPAQRRGRRGGWRSRRPPSD